MTPSDPHHADGRTAQLFRYGLGGILVFTGLGVLFYGGYLAAFATSDGTEPHHLAGFAFCWAGVLIMGIGLKLCGVEWNWRDRY